MDARGHVPRTPPDDERLRAQERAVDLLRCHADEARGACAGSARHAQILHGIDTTIASTAAVCRNTARRSFSASDFARRTFFQGGKVLRVAGCKMG